MIDHITICVKDLKRSKHFYDQVLAALDMKVVIGGLDAGFIGYGVASDPTFELIQCNGQNPAHKKVHVAFKAKSKQATNKFYQQAIAAGAKDNGEPGLRPKYSPTYYACFVFDPDDNNIEACIH